MSIENVIIHARVLTFIISRAHTFPYIYWMQLLCDGLMMTMQN